MGQWNWPASAGFVAAQQADIYLRGRYAAPVPNGQAVGDLVWHSRSAGAVFGWGRIANGEPPSGEPEDLGTAIRVIQFLDFWNRG